MTDEQSLDPETLAAYKRQERLVCQGTPALTQEDDEPSTNLNAVLQPMQLTQEEAEELDRLLDEGSARWQQTHTEQPDLHHNVFRQEWIAAAIERQPRPTPEEMEKAGIVMIDEAVEMPPEDWSAIKWALELHTAQPADDLTPRPIHDPDSTIADLFLGFRKETTSGTPVAPAISRWPMMDHAVEAGITNGRIYRYEPPVEQWWLEAMRYLQQQVLTILSIPEDYLTDIHKSDLDALAYELRERIEDHYE